MYPLKLWFSQNSSIKLDKLPVDTEAKEPRRRIPRAHGTAATWQWCGGPSGTTLWKSHVARKFPIQSKVVPSGRRKFRSQTSDNMDRWKAEMERVREKRKIRREKRRRERVRRKKMEMREKVGKSRNTVFFQWFGAPEGRKVGSLKRRVRSQLARWEIKNCTPLWREAHLQVKMHKTHQVRTTFGSWDVEKVHAAVAWSTFQSQNVQNTPLLDHFWKLQCRKSARRCGAKHISKSKCTKHTSFGPFLQVEMSKKCTPLWREAHFQVKMYKTPLLDHFWKLRCRKSARRCGAKHISKSKCTKHTILGPLLEVEMSKKCTPLWREAHFEVKMLKTPGVRTTFGGSDPSMSKKCTPLWREAHFEVKMLKTPGVRTTFGGSDVEKVHAVVARRTFRSQNVQNTRGSDHFWRFRFRFTTLQYRTLHYTTFQYTTLHYTTLQYTPLH